MKKLVIIPICVLIVGVLVLSSGKQDDTYQVKNNEFKVEKGQLKFFVESEGLLKPDSYTEIKMRPKHIHDAIIQWIIEEGLPVKEGDILCVFDSSELDEKIDKFELDIKTRENELSKAKDEYNKFIIEYDADIKQFEFDVSVAEQDLKKFREIEAPMKLRELEIKVQEAEINFKDAKRKLEAAERMYEADLIPLIELEKARNEKKNAESRIKIAELNLKMYKKFDYNIELAAKEQKVIEKKGGLEARKLYKEVKSAELKTAIQRAEVNLAQEQTRLREAKQDKESLVVKAPIAGYIQFGSPIKRGKRWRNIDDGSNEYVEGNKMSLYQFAMYIPNMKSSYVQVDIDESHITKLKNGDSCFVRFATAPSEAFEGSIFWIARGGSQDWFSDNVTFQVKIRLKEKAEWFKPQLKAEVTIVTDILDDVLFIPLEAIFIREGTHYCFVERGDKLLEQELIIGDNNGIYAHIKAGLKEGDVVLLYEPDYVDGKGFEVSHLKVKTESIPVSVKKDQKRRKQRNK